MGPYVESSDYPKHSGNILERQFTFIWTMRPQHVLTATTLMRKCDPPPYVTFAYEAIGPVAPPGAL